MAKGDPEVSATGVSARLWDVPTRLVHWGLVVLIGIAWWSERADKLDIHRLSGYAVIGLLVFRLYWGFAGSRTARFADFVKGPAATLAYLRTLPARGTKDIPGHNPLGAWSVLALLATLLTQLVTGLFSQDVDGIESGPLTDRVSFETASLFSTIHHWSFRVLEALVILHLAAIAFYLVYKRSNLVGPMITGRRRFATDPGLAFAPVWRIAAGVVLAVLVARLCAKGFRVKL